MSFDVVIVGAGPSGLTMGIRLAQLAQEQERELTICILEKGAEVGAHILSGAVIEPRTLSELIPDWKEKGAPLNVPVKSDSFKYLTEKGAVCAADPTADAQRGQLHHQPRQPVPLAGRAGRGTRRGNLPRFAAAEVLYDDTGAVRGVATGDMGIGKDGEPGDSYEPGVELLGRQTIFAEGCRGSLAGELMEKFNLRDGVEAANLRHRHQGNLGSQTRAAQRG